MKQFNVILLLALCSCTFNKKELDNPKKRLTDYVSISFSVKEPQDKSKLLAYLTGSAKNRLLAWSDEQFRLAFIEAKRQFIKLSIREIKPINKNEVNITYELTYLDQSKGSDARVTNRRTGEMVFENGNWFIREVHNIKELIEYKNEMSLP